MKKQQRSTKKEKHSATSTQQQPSSENMTSLNTSPKQPEYLKDIYTLPLRNFEQCMLDNNLAALIVSGLPSAQQLTDAWENILQEYSDMMGVAEHRLYLHLMREVELLKIDYESIQVCISTLRKQYSEFFCQELNSLLRTTCTFNVLDEKSYLAELDKCERRSRALKIRLDLKTMEFEAVKNKIGGKGEKIDRNYFTSVLIVLSKHNGYSISKDIFVNEYIEYIKQFNRYCDEIEKMNKKK